MQELKYLQVAYPQAKTTLYFCTEEIQEIIVKHINIQQIEKFTGNDFQNESDHYIDITNFDDYVSFYNLIYEGEVSLMFMDTKSLLKNGFSIDTDLNLTTLKAVSEEQLFEFISPCFDTFRFEGNRCCELLKSRLNEWLIIYTDSNGMLKAEECTDELLESCREKHWL